MGGENCLLHIHVVDKVVDLGTILIGEAVAGGVGYIHHRGTGVHHRLHHAGQVLIVGASRILGIELHIIHETAGIFHRFHCPFNDLLAVRVELILDMAVGGTDAGVNPLPLGILERLGSHLDILLHGTGQGTDGGPGHRLRYLHHRIEIAGTRYREAGFNHIHPQQLQRLCNLYLLNGVQLAAGNLFPISQSGVKNKNAFHYFFLLFGHNLKKTFLTG